MESSPRSGEVKRLFAHESDSGSFTAIRIPEAPFDAFATDLQALGVTPAQVKQ